jgi:diacylglycerol O-acyltransferase / wax synthase
METPETPQHVGALSGYALPAGYKGDFYDDFRRGLSKRLHLVPLFTRKLAPMPLQFANPVWVEDSQVDLDYHVQRLTLPRPGAQAQLEDCVGRLHSELLDRHRPLWRIAVIDGLDNGDVAYYLKVHHATMDGQASVLMAQTRCASISTRRADASGAIALLLVGQVLLRQLADGRPAHTCGDRTGSREVSHFNSTP